MITEDRQWRLMDDGYQDPCGVLLEGSEEEVKLQAELRFQECTGDDNEWYCPFDLLYVLDPQGRVFRWYSTFSDGESVQGFWLHETSQD